MTVGAGSAFFVIDGPPLRAAATHSASTPRPDVPGAPPGGAYDKAESNDFKGRATPKAAAQRSAYGAAPIGTTRYAVPAGARFVSPAGNDGAAGSQAAPWRTLARAVAAAPAGSTIVMRRGVYNEFVQVYGKKLTIQPYPGEAVWLDGSQRVTGWVKEGAVWRKDGWTARFDNTNPTAKHPNPNFNMVDPRYPMSSSPDQVFANGKELEQVGDRSRLRPGTFLVDHGSQRLYLGSDPRGVRVDATRLAEALYVNNAHGSVVRGIGVRRYATPLLRYGAVKGFADNLVFENIVVADTATTGLQVRGRGVIVRRSTIVRSGKLGLGAYQAHNLRLVGNSIDDNNTERFRIVPEAGGIKITSSNRVHVAGNRTEDNLGAGIWVDQYVTDAVIVRNVTRRNTGHGIQFEISDGALIAGNVVADNLRFGIRINEASRARIWNNTVVGNHQRQIDLVDGARRGSGRLTMDVQDIEIRNNLMEGRASGGELLGVEDYTGRLGAGAMAAPDANAYYRPGGPSRALAHWVDRRTGTVRVMTLAEFRGRNGKEGNGISADQAAPFADRTSFTLLPRSAPTKAGLGVPADVAAMLGLRPGARPGIGAPPVPGA